MAMLWRCAMSKQSLVDSYSINASLVEAVPYLYQIAAAYKGSNIIFSQIDQCLAELQPLNSLGLDGLGYHSALTIGAVSVARLVGGSRQDIACAAIDSISRHGVNAIAFNRRNKTSMISATNRIAEGVIDYEFTRLRV